jgi:flagellar hook-length control protein FliK
MQAIFGTNALPTTSISISGSQQNTGQLIFGTGFKQMLGTVQQSIQSGAVGVMAAAIAPAADFTAVLGALVKPVESLMDIPDMDPELVKVAEKLLEEGAMPTMQELALVLGTDAETLMASIQQMASLFTNEEAMKQLPAPLEEAVNELLAKSEDGEELPETVPVAELAAVIQLIAANAPQIMKESDKQAAVTVIKAAQIVQQFTQQTTTTEPAKLLQSVLQQAADILPKEKGQVNSSRQTALQTAFNRYESASNGSQSFVQPKAADTPLAQTAMRKPVTTTAVSINSESAPAAEVTTVRPMISQDALNPVVHQTTKTEQFAMILKTDPRPMNMEQFIEKFTQILGNSNMMKTPNGTKLLIKLYPEQLGMLRIELLQQNGVMTAKILSSTQAVKELLEQNAHQLKHAFSQQNVNVEKVELTNPETRQQMFDRNNQQDRQNGQKRQAEEQQSNQSAEEDTSSFADLLSDIEIEV